MTSTAQIPRSALSTAPTSANPFAGRISGLDGLRALAVAGVLVFHLFPGTLGGGYIGVDVFFVLSGFLITGMLLRERQRTGRIRLADFWRRRARRLLPALVAVVIACGGAAFLVGGDVLVGLWRQVLGAATFSYNWLDIATGSSYFEDTAPELLRNLWSLAVEEQFYLLWPFAVLVLLRFDGRWRVRGAAIVAAGSAVAMLVLSLQGIDTTRLYYGTDTHSFGLALGAALAFALETRPPATWSVRLRRGAGIAGPFALAGLLALAIWLPTDAPFVYRGGLFLASALTAVSIAAVTLPGSAFSRALDVLPLRWIGIRSYGIYLWHWPVYVLGLAWVPQFGLDRNGQLLLGGSSAAIAIAAAAISYRSLETPIRRTGLRTTLRRWAERARADRRGRIRGTVATAAAFALATMTVLGLLTAPVESSTQATIEAGEKAVAAAPVEPTGPSVTPPLAPPKLAPPTPGVVPTGDQITAIGDSVMLASAPYLQKAFPGIDIRAVVSRQMNAGPGVAASLARHGNLRSVLLIGLGTNGPIDTKDIDRMLRAAGPGARAVLVNVQAPRSWVSGVNKDLAAYAAAHRGVELADWRDGIRDHIEYLSPDHIHPGGPKGGRIYVAAVQSALERLAAEPVAADPSVFTVAVSG